MGFRPHRSRRIPANGALRAMKRAGIVNVSLTGARATVRFARDSKLIIARASICEMKETIGILESFKKRAFVLMVSVQLSTELR